MPLPPRSQSLLWFERVDSAAHRGASRTLNRWPVPRQRELCVLVRVCKVLFCAAAVGSLSVFPVPVSVHACGGGLGVFEGRRAGTWPRSPACPYMWTVLVHVCWDPGTTAWRVCVRRAPSTLFCTSLLFPYQPGSREAAVNPAARPQEEWCSPRGALCLPGSETPPVPVSAVGG